MAATQQPATESVRQTVAALWPPKYSSFVYALVAVWGLGDVLSTYMVVAASGSASMEANPWIRILLETEPLLVLVLKAAVVLYAGVVLVECQSIVERVPGWRLWFGVVVTAGWLVVVNNLAISFAAM